MTKLQIKTTGTRPPPPCSYTQTHSVRADNISLRELLAVILELEVGGELGRAAVAISELVLTWPKEAERRSDRAVMGPQQHGA